MQLQSQYSTIHTAVFIFYWNNWIKRCRGVLRSIQQSSTFLIHILIQSFLSICTSILVSLLVIYFRYLNFPSVGTVTILSHTLTPSHVNGIIHFFIVEQGYRDKIYNNASSWYPCEYITHDLLYRVTFSLDSIIEFCKKFLHPTSSLCCSFVFNSVYHNLSYIEICVFNSSIIFFSFLSIGRVVGERVKCILLCSYGNEEEYRPNSSTYKQSYNQKYHLLFCHVTY